MNDGFDLVAFDGDDTLWHNEPIYRETQAEYMRLLEHYHDHEWIERRLYETEMRNIKLFGYGVKAFVLSMVETAIELTEQRIGGAEIQRIIDLGRAMLERPVVLLDGVEDTLGRVGRAYELMLITKGDLLDQESKIERSGLRDYFRRVEVVSRKDPDSYRRLAERHGVRAQGLVMIGDSLRSDILPVLELGGAAVYIPHAIPWAHEVIELEQPLPARAVEVTRITEVPAALERLVACAVR